MRTENPRVGGSIPPLGTNSEELAVSGVSLVAGRALWSVQPVSKPISVASRAASRSGGSRAYVRCSIRVSAWPIVGAMVSRWAPRPAARWSRSAADRSACSGRSRRAWPRTGRHTGLVGLLLEQHRPRSPARARARTPPKCPASRSQSVRRARGSCAWFRGGAPAFRRCRRAGPAPWRAARRPWRRRTRRAPRRRARARSGACLARLAAASERAQPIGLHG